MADAGPPPSRTPAGPTPERRATSTRSRRRLPSRGEADIAEYRWDIGSVASIDAPDAVVISTPAFWMDRSPSPSTQVEDPDGRTANASTTLFAANADPVVDASRLPRVLG